MNKFFSFIFWLVEYLIADFSMFFNVLVAVITIYVLFNIIRFPSIGWKATVIMIGAICFSIKSVIDRLKKIYNEDTQCSKT